MAKYTPQEEKELNVILKKWQNRAKRLILHDYYDVIAESLSENDFYILQRVTNAKDHKEISTYLWNSGIIEMTLDRVADKIKKAKKGNKKCR